MRLRIDQQRQRIHIRAFELAQLPEFKNFRHHRVLIAQAFQDVGIGRVAALGLASARQVQVFEEKARELLRRVDIDRPVRHVGDFLVEPL